MAEPDPNPFRPPADPGNPYAPPEADLSPVPATPAPRGGPEPFSASLVVGRTWELYKEQFGTVFGVVNATLMINLLYQIAGDRMESNIDQESPMGLVARFAFLAAGLVLQVWLTSGQTIVLLNVARGEPARFSDLFQGGPYVLRYVGATLLCVLAGFLVMGLSVVPGLVIQWLAGPGPNVAAVVVALLGFVAGFTLLVMFGVRFYQYPYLIIDRNAGAIEALKESYALTRGNTAELIGLAIVGGMVAASGLLACVVGILFTIPWSMLLSACVYAALDAARPGGPAPRLAVEEEIEYL